ncbi:hypothetical protein ACA910_008490 [Epithemia clementina (nom. ined.)]
MLGQQEHQTLKQRERRENLWSLNNSVIASAAINSLENENRHDKNIQSGSRFHKDRDEEETLRGGERGIDPLLGRPFRTTTSRTATRTAVSLATAAALVLLVFCMNGRPSWAISSSGSATAAAAAAASTSSSVVTVVGIKELCLAAALVLGAGVLPLQWQARFSCPRNNNNNNNKHSSIATLATALWRACGRCALQLYVTGSILLTPLFRTQQPWIVVAWISFTTFLASREATSRLTYTYPLLRRHVATALVVALAIVLGAACGLGLVPLPSRSDAARTWIPLAGMLLGNAVTATSLAASTLLRHVGGGSPQAATMSFLEYPLMRGATCRQVWHHSVLPSTYRAALTPTLNALSVTGVIHIPGMMTGQLLAGASPHVAASYQVLLLFLIAATNCIAVQCFTQLALHSMEDSTNDGWRRRVPSGDAWVQPIGEAVVVSTANSSKENRNDKHQHTKKNTIPKQPTNWNNLLSFQFTRRWRHALVGRPINNVAGNRQQQQGESATLNRRSNNHSLLAKRRVQSRESTALPSNREEELPLSPQNSETKNSTRVVVVVVVPTKNHSAAETHHHHGWDNSGVVLQIRNLSVWRTSMLLPSFDIRAGDRIGIQGTSGTGKSQLLRTLAGLEPLDRNAVALRHQSPSSSSSSSSSSLFTENKQPPARLAATAATTVTTTLVPCQAMPMSTWRQKVALVPQERPTLEGTPREFLELILSFRRQQEQQQLFQSPPKNLLSNGDWQSASTFSSIMNNKSQENEGSHVEENKEGDCFNRVAALLDEWDLSSSGGGGSSSSSSIGRGSRWLDQPWSTLSGGEVQRVSLAIAIALKPQVLLLDESMSALDDATTRQVERTLQQDKVLQAIPIVLVSHDQAQAKRFCNRILDLTSTTTTTMETTPATVTTANTIDS